MSGWLCGCSRARADIDLDDVPEESAGYLDLLDHRGVFRTGNDRVDKANKAWDIPGGNLRRSRRGRSASELIDEDGNLLDDSDDTETQKRLKAAKKAKKKRKKKDRKYHGSQSARYASEREHDRIKVENAVHVDATGKPIIRRSSSLTQFPNDGHRTYPRPALSRRFSSSYDMADSRKSGSMSARSSRESLAQKHRLEPRMVESKSVRWSGLVTDDEFTTAGETDSDSDGYTSSSGESDSDDHLSNGRGGHARDDYMGDVISSPKNEPLFINTYDQDEGDDDNLIAPLPSVQDLSPGTEEQRRAEEAEEAEQKRRQAEADAAAVQAEAAARRKERRKERKSSASPKPSPKLQPMTPRMNATLRFSSGRLGDAYEVTDHVLGSGAFGTVKLAHSRETGEEFAIKVIPKTNDILKDDEFLDEVHILSRITHPNIIALKDKYQTTDNVYLVMELASGGELFERIITQNKFDEQVVRHIAAQLCDAVAYLHSMGICHRDLKPENILFKDNSRLSTVKVTDFGFAKHLLTKKQLLRAKAKRGTMGYAAPEIFSNHPYNEKCDVWSMGIIVHIMLTGVPPFCDLSHLSNSELQRMPFWRHANRMAKVPKQPITFPKRFFRGISDHAKDFLRCALEVDPALRSHAIDLARHPWLKNVNKLHATQAFSQEVGAHKSNQMGYKSLRVRSNSSSSVG